MSIEINRIKYANMFGPTVGDKIRLADTELFIEIEKDFSVYGEEAKFGGGKTIRDGMAQSARATRDEGVLDFVITNAMIIDHWGIVKGDIGIKDGKVVAVGKAGNPDTMDGITENMIIGASTEVHSGAGLIVTAGGIDTHIHFIIQRSDHHDWWRNRSSRWNQCYYCNTWCLEHSKNARKCRSFSNEFRFFWKRKLFYIGST